MLTVCLDQIEVQRVPMDCEMFRDVRSRKPTTMINRDEYSSFIFTDQECQKKISLLQEVTW